MGIVDINGGRNDKFSNLYHYSKLRQEVDDINRKDYKKVISFKEYLEFLGVRKKIDNFRSPSNPKKKIVPRFNLLEIQIFMLGIFLIGK
ncbi:hypothetical protein LCGC14_1879960 [marine sediment metagenome]|uniref:Uncharacterized protein n=1 Tax=marine sediment metagenome TaxID=412755 RepID=A0A0F9G2L5_9ZZZZ